MDPTLSTALGNIFHHPDPKGAAGMEPARCAQGSRGSWQRGVEMDDALPALRSRAGSPESWL